MEKEIKVKGCCSCPFKATEYDDFAIDYDSIDICQLSLYYNSNDNIIDIYDMNNDQKKSKTPTWCPLLGNKINISYE